MRAIIGLALGIALAVVGSLAVAGSSYTQPAASGGGVEGDGTGVTDASAFRSALGLGTAATLTAGTAANNAVQLDGDGKLPAVDGSALTGVTAAAPSASAVPYAPASAGDWANPDPTEVAGALDTLAARMVDAEAVTTDPEVSSLADLEWSSGTQIPAYLGSGTASLLPVGSGALNIVQLDADSKLPAVDGSALTGISTSPYAADEWDAVWEAADGLGSWTTAGGASTTEIATVDGKSAAKMYAGSSFTGQSYFTLTTAPDQSFEMRMLVHIDTTMASNDPNAFIGFGAFGKKILLTYATPGITLYTASTTFGTGYLGSGVLTSDWALLTIRVTSPDVGNTSPTASACGIQVWLGDQLAISYNLNPLLAQSLAGDSDGKFQLAMNTTTGPVSVAWVAYRVGHNDAPASYTYRGLGYAPDVAAPSVSP